MTKKVCIVPPYFGADRLFTAYGWDMVTVEEVFFSKVTDPDVVVFTGGEDIAASFYGELTVDNGWTDLRRDKREFATAKMAIERELPCAGICRGGQLLNIYGGGSMYQHVGGHFRNHLATDKDGFQFWATSVHHQMMIPGKESELVAWANPKDLGTKKYKGIAGKLVRDYSHEEMDYEALYYPNIKSFCFQPHPEYAIGQPLADLWFDYLRFYLGVG